MYKPVTNSRELKSEIKALKSVWSHESIITTRAVVYICELLERALAQPIARKARAASPWQRFFGRGMQAGKAPFQISNEWRARKRR